MGRRPVELHPAAIEEARAAREWYAARSTRTAAAFDAELDRAIEAITAAPQRWPTYLQRTRCYLMLRFPYVVVYRETTDRVQVIAVAHRKRRPGY